ncbi:hypothetical protein HBH64_110120 [Parastagonospora nodorum]|nr:hypothetical protein HBH49_195200 [Parastagonospora nodorum]KAH4173697.1 hypothetical protein HBH43_081230 [Parastagonospora nodorum]KAH4228259.1 hypothetical protein HBI06_100570 [Parastagonospora nodorum]KAH4235734.1 hypothetical protein HBI05_144630 [Parastagonospora nodorum]KAH4302151.1 hypothetical protein HBI02_140820 [Parastagonospora nodorum]
MSSDTINLGSPPSTHNSNVGPSGGSSLPSNTQDANASRQLSAFESLPVEIRHIVYNYLCIVAVTNPKEQPKNALSSPDARFRCTEELSGETVADVLIRTNVGIRAEILDILFRLRVIEIKCWPTKSTKLLYRFLTWLNYSKGYGF